MHTFTETYDFLTATEYTYDSAKISISGGQASLILQNDPGNDFNEDFADDTDFTYETDKAEFSGGQVQQKSQKQPNATFGASYTNNVNGNWGDGVLTGSAYNGANVSGGKLDLSGASDKYVDYDADLNADSQQTGCVRFKWTPKYSGAGSFQYLFTIVEEVGVANNRIRIYHQSTLLFYVVSDSTGATIVSAAESFSPIADTEYEIELNWDITTGATRLFVDGNQLGTTQTGTGTRSADIGLLRLGKDLNGNGSADFLIDDLIYFDSVQHTSNYTPGYFVSDYEYAETNVILPEMEYTGAGTLIAATAFVTSISGSPRLTIQIGQSGNWLYWTGSAWGVSNDTYAQATSPADFANNIGDLPVIGEIYGQFKIYFTDTTTQGAFADLTITLTSQIYPTDNQTIVTDETFTAEALITFTTSLTETGSDAIKFLLLKDSTYYRWSGSAWAETTLAYANANTTSEMNSSSDELFDEGGTCAIVIFLHSNDGTTTPIISSLVVTYNWFQPADTAPDTCVVTGYIIDITGEAQEDVEVKAQLVNNDFIDDKNYLVPRDITETVETDENGRFEIELIRSTDYEGNPTKYNFTITLQGVSTPIQYGNISVPDSDTADFNDMINA